MTDAVTVPSTPDGAMARLGELTSDQTWTGKLLAGDATTRGEFDSLSRLAAGDGEAIAAATTAANDQRNFADFAKGAREIGVSDAVLAQIAKGDPVSQADHEVGTNWLKRLANDPDMASKYLRGDSELKQKAFLASVLAVSTVKDGAAAFAPADLLKIGQNQNRDLSKEL
jgi:hypothetical protein